MTSTESTRTELEGPWKINSTSKMAAKLGFYFNIEFTVFSRSLFRNCLPLGLSKMCMFRHKWDQAQSNTDNTDQNEPTRNDITSLECFVQLLSATYFTTNIFNGLATFDVIQNISRIKWDMKRRY